MRMRLVVLATVLVVVAIQLSRESGRAVAPLPSEPEILPSAMPVPRVAPPSSTLGRNPFRFANEDPTVRPSRMPSIVVAKPPSIRTLLALAAPDMAAVDALIRETRSHLPAAGSSPTRQAER